MTRLLHAVPKRPHVLLLMAVAGIGLLIFGFVIKYRQDTAALRPRLFVQSLGSVNGAQFSHDGRFLITTEGKAEHPLMTFRDAATGQIVRQWPGGGWGPTWFSDDGKRMLEEDYPSSRLPNASTRCVLRDAVTGRVLRQWTGRIGDVRPDFTLMTVSEDKPSKLLKTGQVVEVATGRVTGQFSLPSGYIDDTRLSRTLPFLSVTGYDTPSCLLRLPGMTSVLPNLPPLRSLRVTQDGSRAYGLSQDGVLHFWSLPSGRHTSLSTGLFRADWATAMDDGTLLVSGEEGTSLHRNPMIQVRSPDGKRVLRSLNGYSWAFSPDGRLLGCPVYGSGGVYEVWNAATGTRTARLDTATDALGQSVNQSDLGNLAIAPDGRHFAYTTEDGLLRFYSLDKPASRVSSARISTDGGRSILSFGDNDTPSSSPVLFDAVMLSDGGVAASGGQRVQVWRPGQETKAIPTDTGVGNINCLEISPDGKQLAGASQYGIWTYDLAHRISTATPMTVFPDGSPGYSPNPLGQPVWLDGPGQPLTVISTGDFEEGPILLTRWDAAGRKLEQKTVVPAKETIGKRTFTLTGAEASPDGKLLAILWNGTLQHLEGGKPVNEITTSGMLELRDTRSGHLLRTLAATLDNPSPADRSGAFGLPTFSPDGKCLAVADDTGCVQVWDTETGRSLGQVSGTSVRNSSMTIAFAEPSSVRGRASIAFAPGNQLLAVVRNDGSIYLYSLRSWLPVAQIGQVQPSSGPGQLSMHLGWLAFAPDGHTLFGFAQFGSDVLAWDVPKVPQR